MMKNITVAFALALLVGCVHKQPKASVALSASSRPDLQSFILKANAAAEQVLKEFNSSDSSQRLGGPFRLLDYKTKVVEDNIRGRAVVRVSYSLTKPVRFRGHPQHFGVWVYKDTGETGIFKGR